VVNVQDAIDLAWQQVLPPCSTTSTIWPDAWPGAARPPHAPAARLVLGPCIRSSHPTGGIDPAEHSINLTARC